jgi:hypothetical protein
VTYAAGVASFDNGLQVDFPFAETYRGLTGERWLGRPISRAFSDPDLSWTMQVFDYGVLAQDPSDGHIFLVKISDVLGRRQTAVGESSDSACTYFRETGHNLCYVFRDFLAAAGQEHFGLPVSEITMGTGGLMYQDFEYARLLWYNGTMARERCGDTFFTERGYDPALRAPAAGAAGPAAGVTQLFASLSRPTLQPGELQTLQAVLTDPTGAGIEGVKLTATLEQDGKAILAIDLPPTDAGGMSSLSFRVPEADPGTRIRVIVRGQWNTANLEAVAEFEVWW